MTSALTELWAHYDRIQDANPVEAARFAMGHQLFEQGRPQASASSAQPSAVAPATAAWAEYDRLKATDPAAAASYFDANNLAASERPLPGGLSVADLEAVYRAAPEVAQQYLKHHGVAVVEGRVLPKDHPDAQRAARLALRPEQKTEAEAWARPRSGGSSVAWLKY